MSVKINAVLFDSIAMYNQRLNYFPARQAIQAGIGTG